VEELLAQVIEEVSVLAADKRRKEARVVRRPYQGTTSDQSGAGLTRHESGGVTAVGHEAVLSMFRGRVKVAAPASAPVEVPGG